MNAKNLIILLLVFLSINLFSNISGEKFSLMPLDKLKTQLKIEESNKDDFLKNANIGLIYYFMANYGEKTSAQSIDFLQKALSDSNDDTLSAYLGSAFTLLANEEEMPGLKLKYVKDGFKILDEVYNRNQDNYEIAVLYIYSSLEVPQSIFKRVDFAINAIDIIMNNFDKLSYQNQAEILYLKGYSLLLKKDNNEAKKYFQKVIDKYNDTEFRKLSELKLKKIKE